LRYAACIIPEGFTPSGTPFAQDGDGGGHGIIVKACPEFVEGMRDEVGRMKEVMEKEGKRKDSGK
jgi:hypothetical protein